MTHSDRSSCQTVRNPDTGNKDGRYHAGHAIEDPDDHLCSCDLFDLERIDFIPFRFPIIIKFASKVTVFSNVAR